MTTEGEEIAIEILNIYIEMGNTLCAIYEDMCPVCMSDAPHLFNRIDRSERVANMSHANEARVFGEEFFIVLHLNLAFLVERDNFDSTAFTLTQHLPRHDIGVVFHFADEDFVTFFQKCLAVGTGHEVEAFSCAAREEDF